MEPNVQTPTAPTENQESPNQQLSETPPSPDKPPRLTKKVKIIIAVVIVILILLIAGVVGAYWYSSSNQTPTGEKVSEKTSAPTPTPDPTADWEISISETDPSLKKYTNTKYGYSFEIPSTWKLGVNEGVLELLILKSPNYSDAGEGSEITISHSPEATDTSIEQGAHHYQQSGFESYIFIDGIKAYKFGNNFDDKISYAEHKTQFINKGTFYGISFESWDKESYNSNTPIYNNILSTFKFTDSVSNIDGEKTRIIIQEDYYLDVNIPRGYFLEECKGAGGYPPQCAYNIIDSEGNNIIKFGKTHQGGERSKPTSITIDGVPMELEYRKDIGCPMDISPKNVTFNLEILYFYILSWCTDSEETQHPVYKQVINSIVFGSKLKEVLLGTAPAPKLKL